LAAAAIAFVGGFMLFPQNNDAHVNGTVLAVVLVVAYFVSRSRRLSLRSAGAAIEDPKMNLEAAKDFIEAIEAAKNARYLMIASGRATVGH
jgi:hypothetical protein